MEKEQLQQKIAEYYGKLPKEAQEVFSSMSWMEALKNIGIKYNLKEDQIEILGTETTLVLLGITHIEEYQNILRKELVLEKEIVEKIILEIEEGILKTIKGQLVETFESNAKSLVEKEEPPLPPYAKIITNDKLLINNETEKVPESYKPTEIPKNIIEEKLKSPTMSKHNVSDYSKPKIDPYREQF